MWSNHIISSVNVNKLNSEMVSNDLPKQHLTGFTGSGVLKTVHLEVMTIGRAVLWTHVGPAEEHMSYQLSRTNEGVKETQMQE